MTHMGKEGILRRIDGYARSDGITDTKLDGLRLFRVSQPVERTPGVYEPSICVIAQGYKRAYLGDAVHVYDQSRYLCCALPMPVVAEVPEATPTEPVLGLLLSIDTRAMTETVLEVESISVAAPPAHESIPGLSLARWDDRFTDALERVLALLDDPSAMQVLGPGRMKELMYAILTGDAGGSVHRALGATREIARSVAVMKENLDEPLSVEDLARRAGMSRAVYHRRFKEATSHSPIQFLKALRLNDAALQLAGGATVSDAAYSVGYASQSQFSREFRRHFGRSPRDWSAAMVPV
jgi:AraC-like DNA-binding protein